MDINDAVREGIELKDLLDAAELEQPVAVADAGRATREGLTRLDALVKAVELAQDKDEQERLILSTQSDVEFQHSVGYALIHREQEVLAYVERIKAMRGLMNRGKALMQIIKSSATNIRQSAEELVKEGRPVGGLLSPVGGERLRAPSGYKIQHDGVWTSDKKILSTPMIIIQVAKDMDLDTSLYELAWLSRGEWQRKWIRAEDLVGTKEITKATGDHTITAVNAFDVVAYLSAFLEENDLPTHASVARMGWVGDSFVVGEQVVGDPVIVTSRDDSDKKRAARYASNGTVDGWFDAIREVSEDPVPMTLIYASLASTLLVLLNAPGFLVDLWCESRHGKTQILKLAASVWGPPSEEVGPIYKWSMKPTGLENQAYFSQNLPLFLDETHLAHPATLSSATYQLCDGSGATRGKPDGTTHAVKTWRLITISTGEKSANAADTKQGAINRSLVINRQPFGARSEATALMLNKLMIDLEANHGTFGPRFIQAVRALGKDRLKEKYRAIRETVQKEVTIRADFVAALLTAGSIAHEIGMPGDFLRQRNLIVQVCRETDRDVPKEAAMAALEWAGANEQKFSGRIPGLERHEPHGGWLGWWVPGDEWRNISFRPYTLRNQLRRMGFDAHGVEAVWRSRGWLEVSARGKNPRIGGVEVLRLKRDALEADKHREGE